MLGQLVQALLREPCTRLKLITINILSNIEKNTFAEENTKSEDDEVTTLKIRFI